MNAEVQARKDEIVMRDLRLRFDATDFWQTEEDIIQEARELQLPEEFIQQLENDLMIGK